MGDERRAAVARPWRPPAHGRSGLLRCEQREIRQGRGADRNSDRRQDPAIELPLPRCGRKGLAGTALGLGAAGEVLDHHAT